MLFQNAQWLHESSLLGYEENAAGRPTNIDHTNQWPGENSGATYRKLGNGAIALKWIKFPNILTKLCYTLPVRHVLANCFGSCLLSNRRGICSKRLCCARARVCGYKLRRHICGTPLLCLIAPSLRAHTQIADHLWLRWKLPRDEWRSHMKLQGMRRRGHRLRANGRNWKESVYGWIMWASQCSREWRRSSTLRPM